ncbi:MAG: hypothetical protein OER88_05330, partial [Planctomycetota bacterium]|nr:hypothetical protein [Planctomycetota bacterium]
MSSRVAVLLLLAGTGLSEIKSDERVVFFTTTAALDGAHWVAPIHGWIFEPERDSKWRNKVISEVQEHLHVDPNTPAGKRCADRTALFLVDNERGKRIRIRIAGRLHTLAESGPNGHFRSTLRLSTDDVKKHARDGALSFLAITQDDDKRRFAGRVLLTPPVGVGVISDIDDTIKISHVLDKKALLR